MGRQAETRETDVVRLAPEEDGDVIWFTGPVSLEDSNLSEDLIREVEEWERFFHSHLKHGQYVVVAESMPHFKEEGIRLARRLANEIGSTFVVEFVPDERHPSPRRFRSAGRPTNAAAARVFSALAAQDENDGWTIGLSS